MGGQLSFLTLPVHDLAAARCFYEAVFGWSAPRPVTSALLFQLSNLTVALMQRTAFDEFIDAGSTAAAVLVSWNVPNRSDVGALIQRSRDAGATVRREPALLEWGGWAGIIETPDRHLWEIVWNPRPSVPAP